MILNTMAAWDKEVFEVKNEMYCLKKSKEKKKKKKKKNENTEQKQEQTNKQKTQPCCISFQPNIRNTQSGYCIYKLYA